MRSTRTKARSDAERILAKWTSRAALEREGLVAPEGGAKLDRHAAASLSSHLEAYEAAKRSEGRTERYVGEAVSMIRDTADGCGWRSLGDVAADDLERFIARRRGSKIAEAGDKALKPWTPRTAAKRIGAVQSFTRWCVLDGRLAADPLARIRKPAAIRQRERRILLEEEWKWLRSVTEDGPERYGMDGPSRRLLYAVAIETGLRLSELRSLTRTSLQLSGERPHVLVAARSTKNRKAARQYVRPALAASLAGHVSRMMPGAAVFAMPASQYVPRMLRADLETARAKWIDAAGSDATERVRREGTAFLSAEDHDGRVFDFHALRHTSGAWAAMGGASPKAIQTLMRHSTITLTLDTYGHLLPDEAAETVERMPDVEPVAVRLTGTDDVASPALAEGEAPAAKSLAPVLATRGRNRAPQCDSTRPGKSENAAPVLGAAFSKAAVGFEPTKYRI